MTTARDSESEAPLPAIPDLEKLSKRELSKELLRITIDLLEAKETTLDERIEMRLTTLDSADTTEDIGEADGDKVGVFFEDKVR